MSALKRKMEQEVPKPEKKARKVEECSMSSKVFECASLREKIMEFLHLSELRESAPVNSKFRRSVMKLMNKRCLRIAKCFNVWHNSRIAATFEYALEWETRPKLLLKNIALAIVNDEKKHTTILAHSEFPDGINLRAHRVDSADPTEYLMPSRWRPVGIIDVDIVNQAIAKGLTKNRHMFFVYYDPRFLCSFTAAQDDSSMKSYEAGHGDSHDSTSRFSLNIECYYRAPLNFYKLSDVSFPTRNLVSQSALPNDLMKDLLDVQKIPGAKISQFPRFRTNQPLRKSMPVACQNEGYILTDQSYTACYVMLQDIFTFSLCTIDVSMFRSLV